MNSPNRPATSHTGYNPFLLRAVPASARKILEAGCAEGNLGAALKHQDPLRQVWGIERDPALARRAVARLDRVFCLDVEIADPPVEPGTLDCILYGDVLERLVDPEQVLRRHRPLLGPQGTILCCVPNIQHHSVVTALLTSDFQYESGGLLDRTHLRFFTYSTSIKLLLDAGFAPHLLDAVSTPCPRELTDAARPLLAYLGLHPGRTQRYLSAYQYIFRGTPLAHAEEDLPGMAPADPGQKSPLTFVACISNEQTLRANLLSSPCLGPPSPHEVLLIRGAPTAAHGLNQGIARARNPLVVCLHQDVYLPRGWPGRFIRQYRQAEKTYGTPGVAGVYGVALRGELVAKAGHVVDRDRVLREPTPLPALVDTLDELLLAVPKDTPLAFEPALGFHFYGADLCLSARQRGLPVVAVDALCFHNSQSVGLPPAFYPSSRAFVAKWARSLPVATSCVVIDRQGGMRLS